MSDKPTRKLRCAIYTRKSSEEGLEQSFNSLHAQREACEAYIKSQSGEGWSLVKAAYDDGGFSGGTMERPALKQLLKDVEAGLVDTIVVYKVDRLTRSLHDFARIVQVFDAAGASFVSITQAFNTTTSMGRLTLNVLLSFAQFEREVTGERIRDKIAQSKAKGMWMGGNLPLGYDAGDHTLIVNAEEADTVRWIFNRYLELGSVHALEAELQALGIESKRRTTRSGKEIGGETFSRGALYHLLQNRHYLGQITHKQQAFPGLHPGIVEPTVFAAVQRTLATNRVERVEGRRGGKAMLTGRVFDDAGAPYTPSFSTGRGGKLYRYYIAKTAGSEAPARVPADDLERYVTGELRRVFLQPEADQAGLLAGLRRVEVRAGSVELVLDPDLLFGEDHPELAMLALQARLEPDERAVVDPDGAVRVSLPVRLRFRGGRTWLTGADRPVGLRAPTVNKALVAALRQAHVTLAGMGAPLLRAPTTSASSIQAPPTTFLTRLVKLAFLAPDLQQDILEGRLGRGLGVKQLIAADIPIAWDDQRRWIRSL